MDTLVIQLTCKCPLDCEQCYMKKRELEIDYETAIAAIDQAKSLGVKLVQLTGGEPMLYSRLKDIIQYCSHQHLYVVMATSGFAHTPAGYAELFDIGLTEICISLNSSNEQENRQTRDGYALSIGAIKDVLELGKPCAVNIVVSHNSMETLENTIVDILELGCEEICLLKRFPSIRGENIPPMSRRDIQKLCDIADGFADIVQVENCFLDYWAYRKQRKYSCMDAGKSTCFVNVDGSVSPCSQSTQYRFADVTELREKADQWRMGYCYAENI